MSFLHSFTADKLVSCFQEIVEIDTDIMDKKDVLLQKLNDLKSTYQQLVKNNNKKIMLFCLDAFYFQYKILTNEMDDISKSIVLINNRMYGDYYKLYNIIIAQSREKGFPLKTINENKKYVIYKDLEPFKEFSIDEISAIHQGIIEIISELHEYHNQLEKSTYQYNNVRAGTSITNFMHTLEYENMLIREQYTLYMNYLSFFHDSHKKYLTKLYNKLAGFQIEVDEDMMTNGQLAKTGEMDRSQIDIELGAETILDDTLLTPSDENITLEHLDSSPVIDRIGEEN
jgi:hypothetical protein